MNRPLYQELLLPPAGEDQLWEVFHENSKLTRLTPSLSDEEVLERMAQFHGSLPFDGYPAIDLPTSLCQPRATLIEAVVTRASERNMKPCLMPFETLASLLHYSYGINRAGKSSSSYSSSPRVVPSAGGLYPLEIFIFSGHSEGLNQGLYHYNPLKNNLRFLRQGDFANRIANAMAYPQLALNSSLLIFITAIFERSVFKYGDRGYRFVLLEAGHVAQNINLVATALNVASVNIGGFFDRDIDAMLDIDGVTHSTIYSIAIGGKNS